jgi:NAD(P)-dependent dehydrogenase (short-subunit alcohol dehydrogenase family)
VRIVHVGASGVIGKAVSAELARRHDVIAVGRSTGDFQVDIDNPSSISRMFSQIGEFDALICTAGRVHFAPLAEFTIEQYAIGLQSKLMGQVNLVRLGLGFLREEGSFTLTSGKSDNARGVFSTLRSLLPGRKPSQRTTWCLVTSKVSKAGKQDAFTGLDGHETLTRM